MASGTNAYLLSGDLLNSVFPHLTYLRVNISAGEPDRYQEIMGSRVEMFSRVCSNIREMVELKRSGKSRCMIGMQMVFMPDFEDQLIPLAKLAVDLGADYLVIKHCSDDELGTLGVKYGDYAKCYPTLRRAEALSNDVTTIRVKWSKIEECTEKGAIRTYSRCYGTPFLLQISGTGLVAPCGMLFNERYKNYHMGNITEKSFREIWESEDYWKVIDSLKGSGFDARRMCGSLCLQHSVNKYLDAYKKGKPLEEPIGEVPPHIHFV
jgi:radical SAM protein with 4Fe4S-binding SPASM domain